MKRALTFPLLLTVVAILASGNEARSQKTKWTASVELTDKAGKWLLVEAKVGTKMLSDRDFLLSALPKEVAGGTYVLRDSGQYRSWLPDLSLKAKGASTVYAIVRTRYLGKVAFDEKAQAAIVKDGWKEVEGKAATTFPSGEKWEWKTYKLAVEEGGIILQLDNCKWDPNRSVVLYIVKSNSTVEDAPKDKPKATVYKTPQEVFDALETAESKKDYKTWVDCLAPVAQKEIASQLAIAGLEARAAVKGEKDAEKRALLTKLFGPILAALDKHGLTEKATKDIVIGKTPAEQKKASKAAAALLQDSRAFLSEILPGFDALDPKEPGKKEKAKLTNVKIDGDKATGIVVTPGKQKGSEDKEPVSFVKIDGGWLVIPAMAAAEPEKKDEKDKAALKPEFKLSSEALVKEFLDDAKAAKKKYGLKVVEIEGKVKDANKSRAAKGFYLHGADSKKRGFEVTVLCAEVRQLEKVWLLGAGQKVKVVGLVVDDFGAFIALGDCTVTTLEPSPTRTVTAKQLTADFAKDESAAKKKYLAGGKEKKELIVEGTVVALAQRKDGRFDFYDALLEGESGHRVRCDIGEKDYKALKKGDKVAIKGDCGPFSFDEEKKMVSLSDAFILSGGAAPEVKKSGK